MQPLPRWTQTEGHDGVKPADAAFAAGAALFALDQMVRANPPWLGALRMRQALAAAAVSARLFRLREDEVALRDAHHLTRPADDPGPAGRLHRAWRALATRSSRLDPTFTDRIAHELGVTPTPNLLDRLAMAQRAGSPVAIAAEVAARVAAEVTPAHGPEAEVLGLMLADVALAQKLGWAAPVPLLATAILHPALRIGAERRPYPGDPGWAAACHGVYARAAGGAHARALDLARRADRLFSVAGKVRTRGRANGLNALLAEDAVAATALKDLGSDRAARRFLERLASLGAIRELTGRPTFRLYGL